MDTDEDFRRFISVDFVVKVAYWHHTAIIHFAGLIYRYRWRLPQLYYGRFCWKDDILVPFSIMFEKMKIEGIGSLLTPISLYKPNTACTHFAWLIYWYRWRLLQLHTFPILRQGYIMARFCATLKSNVNLTALVSQWRLYLFTDTKLHSSVLCGLSMGIYEDVHHLICFDWGNGVTCWYHFWTSLWALDSISLSMTPISLYTQSTAFIHFVRLIYGYMWWRSSYYSGWLGQ